MTDAEKEIREALSAGPTPGPWCIHPETDGTEICAVDLVPGLPIRQVIAHPKHGANWIANARLIAACSPANVRELLDEMDRLRAERDNNPWWRKELVDKLIDRETQISNAWAALRAAGVQSETNLADAIALLAMGREA